MLDTPEQFVSRHAAARMIGVSPRTINRMLNENAPAIRTVYLNRQTRVSLTDLLAVINTPLGDRK